jgi:hypothetical protein
MMSVSLLLSDAEEAVLRARARAEGTTAEEIVRNAIAPLLADDGASIAGLPQPTSLLGLWKEFGPGPSEEEIDENRAEMFAAFDRDDFA